MNEELVEMIAEEFHNKGQVLSLVEAKEMASKMAAAQPVLIALAEIIGPTAAVQGAMSLRMAALRMLAE